VAVASAEPYASLHLEGKCKWFYGPSCPVVFPLNIFIRSRQITTPVPHHSVFYKPDALPAAQPIASKH